MSNLYVSDFISDHRALHVSLTCSRAHPERKQIEVRSLKRIQCDVLEADLIGVNIDRECTDVNLVVRQYDSSLSSLLDKHAPSKRIYVVERPMNDWMFFWIYPLLLTRLTMIIYSTYSRNMSELAVVHYG